MHKNTFFRAATKTSTRVCLLCFFVFGRLLCLGRAKTFLRYARSFTLCHNHFKISTSHRTDSLLLSAACCFFSWISVTERRSTRWTWPMKSYQKIKRIIPYCAQQCPAEACANVATNATVSELLCRVNLCRIPMSLALGMAPILCLKSFYVQRIAYHQIKCAQAQLFAFSSKRRYVHITWKCMACSGRNYSQYSADWLKRFFNFNSPRKT